MRVIAYKTSEQNNKVQLLESTGEFVLSNSLEKLFTFLVEPYEDTIKVCWNLDATVSLILRLLGTTQCRKIRNTKRGHCAPFAVFYIPGKVFSVQHIPTGERANLYGIDQYYPELEEQSVGDIQLLGAYLLEQLKEIGMEPTKLTSPVAVYEECILKKLDLPQLKDMPLQAAEYAFRASGKLWIESHRLGYFENVRDYDLSSAFPNIAKDLIDTRDCVWRHSKVYQDKAVYGYVKCQVLIREWVMVSPILYESSDCLISPVGPFEAYLTKAELDFINKWHIGKYLILDGYWAMPIAGKTLWKPLEKPMVRLLEYKQGNELQRLLAKRMSNGIYGKFGEEREEEFGPYFLPHWFAEISTNARLEVAEFLYQNGIGPDDNDGYKTLLHIGVDGVMASCDITTNGQWRLDYQGKALIVSSGLVYTDITKPKGLTLKEVLEMINEHPRRMFYQKKLPRRLTLADSLAKDRLEDIGKPFDFLVSLSFIVPDYDRDFEKVPRSGGALLNRVYKSRPKKA